MKTFDFLFRSKVYCRACHQNIAKLKKKLPPCSCRKKH